MQTSIQSLVEELGFTELLSNATEIVGINAFSSIAKMAIQLETTRFSRDCMR